MNIIERIDKYLEAERANESAIDSIKKSIKSYSDRASKEKDAVKKETLRLRAAQLRKRAKGMKKEK